MDDQLIIEQYTAGKLTPIERTAFEARLAQESDLAESLRLYQLTQRFMAQREPALEQLLNTMGNKYFPAKRWYQKWYLWASFCLLIMIAIAIVYSEKPASPSSTTPAKEESTATKTTDYPTVPLSETPDEPVLIDDASPVEPSPSRPSQKSTSKSPPIAALDYSIYDTNPVLEGLWQEQLRNNLYFELLKPLRDTSFILQRQITFHLAARTTLSPPYELRVYSNAPTDFYNDERVLNARIVEANRLTDTFAIDQSINLPLKHGLYYWLLVGKSDKLLSIGKFKIVDSKPH